MDVITVSGIKNVGRGVAVHVQVLAGGFTLGRQNYFGFSDLEPLLAVDQEWRIVVSVHIYWEAAKPPHDEFFEFAIDIRCSDVNNREYQTRYTANVTRTFIDGGNFIAPGVFLPFRLVTHKSRIWVEAKHQYRRWWNRGTSISKKYLTPKTYPSYPTPNSSPPPHPQPPKS